MIIGVEEVAQKEIEEDAEDASSALTEAERLTNCGQRRDKAGLRNPPRATV